MKILYLNADPGVPVLGHKGASIHVREMSRALSQQGAEILIAATNIAPEGAESLTGISLQSICGVLPKKLSLDRLIEAVDAQAVEVEQIARSYKAQAIYERFSLFSAAGTRAAQALQIPLLLEVNAPLRKEAARFRTLPYPDEAERLEREVLQSAQQVMVVSAPLIKHVMEHGAHDVMVMPNGVSAQTPVAVARDDNRFVVGFAGSLKPWHGVKELLQACDMASVQVPELVLEILGHGPLSDMVEAASSDRVLNLGALAHKEARARIATWDVGAAPYLELEDFWFSPLKVLEYMAAGVCPVASALGELPELLGQGTRGMLVTPGDPGALAESLVFLALHQEERIKRARRAREHVVAHRSWSALAAQVLLEARS